MSNYSDQIRNSGLMETYWDNHIDDLEAKMQKSKDALFPREILEPAYREFMSKYSTSPNPSAHEFFFFLLRQTK